MHGRYTVRFAVQWQKHTMVHRLLFLKRSSGGPQISDVIQSLKSAERKWITRRYTLGEEFPTLHSAQCMLVGCVVL